MINVAVTGLSGFIGQHLVSKNSPEIRFHNLPLRDIDNYLDGKRYDFKIDHVIHLAAKTFVPDSWNNPSAFYEVNVLGTQKALEFCRINNCGITYVSSYVYGIPAYLPIDENHSLAPNTPYNHSKLMGESLCEFYYKSFNVNATVIRPFNLYGPNQNKSFLIPEIIEQAIHGNKIHVKSLNPKRDFLYIDDFIDFLMLTISKKGYAIFNIGSGKSYSVSELITLVKKNAGKPNLEIISDEIERPGEVMDVVADTTKAERTFLWKPKYTIESGLKKIINTYA